MAFFNVCGTSGWTRKELQIAYKKNGGKAEKSKSGFQDCLNMQLKQYIHQNGRKD